jgi:hypothetical protein
MGLGSDLSQFKALLITRHMAVKQQNGYLFGASVGSVFAMNSGEMKDQELQLLGRRRVLKSLFIILRIHQK